MTSVPFPYMKNLSSFLTLLIVVTFFIGFLVNKILLFNLPWIKITAGFTLCCIAGIFLDQLILGPIYYIKRR